MSETPPETNEHNVFELIYFCGLCTQQSDVWFSLETCTEAIYIHFRLNVHLKAFIGLIKALIKLLDELIRLSVWTLIVLKYLRSFDT